jgi:hypothetical protein
VLFRGQENMDPLSEEDTSSDGEASENYMGPAYDMHVGRSTSVMPLSESSAYNHAMLSRNRSNARSPYWFAK